MNRPLLKLSLLLLSALLFTIALAWICILRPALILNRTPLSTTRTPSPIWPRPVPADWPAPDYHAQWRIFGVRTSTLSHLNNNPPGKYYDLGIHRAGWPFPALESVERSGTSLRGTHIPGFKTLEFVSLERGLRFDRERPDLPNSYVIGWLPLRPLWPGLLADTLFFAAIPWSLTRLFSLARARLRQHRNLCPRCAYNLRGLPSNSPCPECGHAPITKTPDPPSSPAGRGVAALGDGGGSTSTSPP